MITINTASTRATSPMNWITCQALLATMTLASMVIAEDRVPIDPPANEHMRIGEYRRIYDPSVGEDEPWYINDHTFIHDEQGVWHLFGITHEEPANPLDERFFAHATSNELSSDSWEKKPPALSVSPESPWNETLLWAPHVIRHDGLYYMFYCAGGESHTTYKLHLATSPDLKTWTRSEANPLVIDGYDARDPCVFRHADQWIMYYTATRPAAEGNHVVIAVTSDDLLHWTDPKVVFTHLSVGKWGGPTESPFVFRRQGKFYLSTCDMPPYDKTTFYVSDNPYHWDLKDAVGTTPAHCAEVVRDGETWYVSRAGWGRGGVYLAELTWLDPKGE